MYRNKDSRFDHDRAQNSEPTSAKPVSIVLAKKESRIIAKAVY